MGFFKNMLRMNTSRIGNVTGSDFNHCYISTAKKDGRPALIIYGTGKEDFLFDKSDVKEFSVIETNTLLIMENKRFSGNKYRIVFHNGKSAVLSIPTKDCAKVEEVLY